MPRSHSEYPITGSLAVFGVAVTATSPVYRARRHVSPISLLGTTPDICTDVFAR